MRKDTINHIALYDPLKNIWSRLLAYMHRYLLVNITYISLIYKYKYIFDINIYLNIPGIACDSINVGYQPWSLKIYPKIPQRNHL